jgi:hypothetical protein
MTFYRNIISDSWRFSLRNAYLWFFGLFAVLLGNGGEYEIFFKSIGKEGGESIWSGFWTQLWSVLTHLPSVAKSFWKDPYNASLILLVYAVLIALFVFIIWMINVSQAAIVDSVSRQSKEKEHNLRIGLENGIANFWPVFALNVALKLAVVVGLALIGLFGSALLNTLIFMVLIPALIAFSFIVKYAIAYVVVRKEKLLDSFKHAFLLFKKNWIISLELAFILYLATIVAGLLFVFITFNVTKFFEVITAAFPTSAFLVWSFIFPFILFGILALIGAIVAVFQISTWTKLFVELDSVGAISKIERIFAKRP